MGEFALWMSGFFGGVAVCSFVSAWLQLREILRTEMVERAARVIAEKQAVGNER